MNASILLIGSNPFLETFSQVIQNWAMFTVEMASHPHEAMSLIQAQQPDLLLVQANEPGCLELCQRIKAQHQLAWIYCVVVDYDAEEVAGDAGSLTWKTQMQKQVQAIQWGADAYLLMDPTWFYPAQGNREDMPEQWLKETLLAGLRRVQNQRELMRTNDILSAIALVDPLTELNNRRALEWELPRQIQSSRSRQMPLSLLMLDVDFFKAINDTHGHVVGDRALQLVAARLRHNLRFYDTPFRYGGEEFVVVLNNTGDDEAEAVADRICDLIGSQPFAVSDDLELSITISAGVTTLQNDDDIQGNHLLQRADRNLLHAKEQGRNQVVFSNQPLDKYH